MTGSMQGDAPKDRGLKIEQVTILDAQRFCDFKAGGEVFSFFHAWLLKLVNEPIDVKMTFVTIQFWRYETGFISPARSGLVPDWWRTEKLPACPGLDQAGFDYSPFQPHLDSAILAALGLTDERDETYAFYFRVMEEHAEKIDQHSDTIAREASNVYRILMGVERVSSINLKNFLF